MSSNYITTVLTIEEFLRYVSESGWNSYVQYLKAEQIDRITKNGRIISRKEQPVLSFEQGVSIDMKSIEKKIGKSIERIARKQKKLILENSEIMKTLALIRSIRKNLTTALSKKVTISSEIVNIEGKDLSYDDVCYHILCNQMGKFPRFMSFQPTFTYRFGHRKVNWELYKEMRFINHFQKDLQLASDRFCGKVEFKEIVYAYDPKKEESCVVM